jgi:hypothetical protein|tara:strand:+ start:407 stop:631 length:225 start_codon:yes stop_codon:yes gene_type:complete
MMQNALYIEKNRNIDIGINMGEFKGHELLNIRECWVGRDGERTPTRKGITIPKRCAKEFYEALTKVLIDEEIIS